ncbi:MAG: hydrogenase 2 operon protein HybA [Deferribacteraceae bacterium]|nr:hydrogenase 2 operon protein HybA [Deferribacteraceae bacterium]
MKSTRRRFLQTAVAGIGLTALSPTLTSASEEKGFGADEVGMLYDSTLCVGCKACVYACRSENFDADPSSELDEKALSEQRWQDVYELDYRTKNIIKLYQNPEDLNDFAFIKRQCNHCNSPGCVSACPVKAMTKNPVTGVVQYDKGICIGCRYCQMACPFNVPTFEWHAAFPKISKCELCRQTEAGTPACCRVCPAKAVIYDKRSVLLAEAKRRLAENPDKYINKIYGEFDYGGTNVLYISRVDFEKLGLPNLPNYSYASRSEKIQHTLYKTFNHVPIAPVALYATLAAVAFIQHKRRSKGDGGEK